MYQINKLTPDFFYKEVAKKVGVDEEIVKDIYLKYLNRLQDLSKTETKIMVRGLGTFELDPKKLIYNLYTMDGKIYNQMNLFLNDCVDRPKWILSTLDTIQILIKKVNQLKTKYGFIERSMENFWANSRGIKELFDNEGNYRRHFEKENGDLSELSEEEWDEMWGMWLHPGAEDEMSIM